MRLGTACASDNETPYVPASPDVVLQQVPSTSDPRIRLLDRQRAELASDPRNTHRALILADGYIDYGRTTGDARYLGRAQAVIEPWLQGDPAPVSVLLVHATILQSRHAFDASRKELAAIVARDPGNAQAWLTLATVAMVQGDYKGANAACVRLAGVGGDFMGTLCTAQLRTLTGHTQQAYALLSFIEHPGPEAPDAMKAYVEGLMADAAQQLGKADEAEAHFKQALLLTPGDNFLLADYSDFLLDQDRPRDVLYLVEPYVQSDTSFLRRVLAQARLASPDAERDIDAMRARFAAMDQRGSHLYDREEARFALHLEHDPARALALAERNWGVQRAPQDMRILLEAALAAGRPKAAEGVLALLAASHLEDASVRRLAERVAYALRETSSSVALRDGASP